jgi:hippurate hydrolase
MPVLNRIADFAPEIAGWRQDFHAHPELGFQEERTSGIVATLLAGWGIEVHRGLAGTGVVGVLRCGTSSRAVGLRADMDCLPMTERPTDRPHRSTVEGRMHACGHDGHTAMLLGAAKYLAETRNFDGTVHFIFQPAEEGGGGGRVMVEQGLFERFPCDRIFAIHNQPGIPLGEATITPGPQLAAADGVTITIQGLGGHAARPQGAIDPVLVGSHIVVALQSLVARRTDPLDSAVVSICQFHAGSAGNVIPDSAVLNGTIRTLKPETRALMETLVRQVAEGTAAAHGATAEVVFRRGYPPMVNDAEAAARAAAAATRVIPAERIRRDAPPAMGAEDFSYMLEKRPGCMVKLGQKAPDGRGGVPLHHPDYDFNDEAAPIGASILAAIVEQELPRAG